MLLKHGLDPNVMPSEQRIRSTPNNELPEVLRGIKKNFPSILKILRYGIARNKQELAKIRENISRNKQEIETVLRMTNKEWREGYEKMEKYRKAINVKYLEKYYMFQIKFLERTDKLLVQNGARI